MGYKNKPSKVISARYDGFCKACKQSYKAGTPILNDGTRWVHETCPQEPVTVETLTGPRVVKRYTRDDYAAEVIKAQSDLGEAIASVVDDTLTQLASVFVPSIYQQAIFDWIINGAGHLVVEAVAGSGKTRTIVEALALIPRDKKVAFFAYNTHIAKELQARAPKNVHASTLHSAGRSILTSAYSIKDWSVALDEDKVGGILDDFWPVSREIIPDATIRSANRTKRMIMRKIVSLAKSTMIDYNERTEVDWLLDRFGDQIQIEDLFADEVIGLIPVVMEQCKNRLDTFDFDDMLWIPVVHNLKFEQYDWVLDDECQDNNKLQTEFILRCIAPGGRVIAVGDRKQSIYGWRGADTEAIPNMIARLNATTLPLSITYRCPASHVKRVQSIVPQIEAAPNAAEGEIIQIKESELSKHLQPGDMVLCRVNAPLVGPAFKVIRSGQRAVIRGKDIGKNLIARVERYKADTLDALSVSLEEFFQREYQRLLEKGKEMQAINLADEVETLRLIIRESNSVAQVISKLRTLFDDNNIGVVFSSVHRAKGLEAQRVFILRPELLPHPKAAEVWQQEQERNIEYVAGTRSKQVLYIVTNDT